LIFEEALDEEIKAAQEMTESYD